MLKRILLGLGGTDYTTSAINQAVALAMAHDAKVTGVSVVDEAHLRSVGPVPIGAGHHALELVEHRLGVAKERVEQAIAQFEDACASVGVRYRVRREIGEPFSLMIDQARYHDLMVFGLRSLFDFDLVPEPHDALVRLVEAGVRPLLAVSKGFAPIKKVLIAYSGSMESAKAMKRFVQMQLWPNLQLRVVSFEDARQDAESLVTSAAEYCRAHGYQVEAECAKGSAKSQLLHYAAGWEADLLVLGNSARSLLLRRMFGETALHVIRNADRPLYLAQ